MAMHVNKKILSVFRPLIKVENNIMVAIHRMRYPAL